MVSLFKRVATMTGVGGGEDFQIRLSAGDLERLKNLSSVRGDEFDPRFVRKIIDNLLKAVPKSVSPQHLVSKESQSLIKDIQRDGNYITLELTDGTVLKTVTARQRYRNCYWCFRDKLPAHFTPESYQACCDVEGRYLAGYNKLQKMERNRLFIPSDTASIIECGAYHGWKAVGFGRHVGAKGTLIVLEIDSSHAVLAEENVLRNMGDKRAIVLNAGIWNRVEERQTFKFDLTVSRSLRPPDEKVRFANTGTMVTQTLDNIIKESGVPVFDLINIQTAGAELEALQGLDTELDRVKVIYVGSHYRHEGVSAKSMCAMHLVSCGCTVYAGTRQIKSQDDIGIDEVGALWAVTPPYRDKLVPRGRVDEGRKAERAREKAAASE